MASLLDLGPLTEEVEIRGLTLTVRGLTAVNLFKLAAKFPELQQIMQQTGGSLTAMLELLPDLFAKAIAIATGMPDNKEAEDNARMLGASDQLAILAAVQRLSMPNGLVPFVEQVTRLMGTITMPSNEQGNSSHVPSSAVLQTDSPGMTRGDSPRVN